VAALVFGAATACKGKPDATKAQSDLEARCEELAKACGDNDKHVAKLLDECKLAAKTQAEKGCAAKATAAYDCYEKNLCGKADKVWALDDLRVLADRKSQCVTERTAASECVGK